MTSSEPIADTHYGRLRGRLEGDVMAFRGIRYARAERFRPPVAPESWTGIADALAFGASAPQSNPNPPPGPPYVILAQLPRPANAPPPPPPIPESEGCLFLNIWTSGLRDGRKRPVMVSLHGGFFYGGSGSAVDGSTLAARGDVVFVSLNHRLNAFGYTHLAGLTEADEFAHAGNAGMQDIIAALGWIRNNIENFGGDPARIMVFGTSGGGMKTSFLMSSPAAQGLIHRAGVQSGPALRFMERDDAATATDRLLHRLNIPRHDWQSLLTLPVQTLLAGYHAVADDLKPRNFTHLPCFAPVLDPLLLPQHPFSPRAAPLTNAIPMLIGCNAQEMSFFWGNDPGAFTLDEAGLEARSQAFLGDRTGRVLSRYRQAYPGATPSRLFLQLFSDYSIQAPIIAQAERKEGAPAFMYRLDYQSPALGGKLGALHTMETPFILNTPQSARALLGEGDAPAMLAAKMSSAWVAFATNGDPNDQASGLPHWATYERSTRATMLFDQSCRVEPDAGQLAREIMGDLVEG
ncbi:para-nitrobenzyl esterase [Sphingobium sp. B1D7B]|uniref:carboxylesterase/lipase family protein n=1 Tax=unclassified Sphingobium TaxID=2611147 RepID=UPI00222483DC|nr:MULTISPECIES: carboxylesterase family protein [unclassified Sphingobium]MCW2391654.1 para-nitrobenzyl esterase [Sphingobium sp. B11D3A]MCW2403409.1 para-nitrobenzyl esterase [Sphingobium sp. B1D7B]